MGRKRKLEVEEDGEADEKEEEEMKYKKKKLKKPKIDTSIVILFGPGFTERRKEKLKRDMESDAFDIKYGELVENGTDFVVPDEVTHIICASSYPKKTVEQFLRVTEIPPHVQVVHFQWLELCKKNSDFSYPITPYLCFAHSEGKKTDEKRNNSPPKKPKVEHVATPKPPLRRQLTSEGDRENIRLDERMSNLDDIEDENEEKIVEDEIKDEESRNGKSQNDVTKEDFEEEVEEKNNKGSRSINWELLGQESVLHGCFKGVQPSSKFIGFDIDGTIIKTASGGKYATSENDWQLFHPCVVDRLRESIENGYKIIFITNQLGVEKGHVSISTLKKKFTNILREIDLPIEVFASLQNDLYRKPRPKMLSLIQRCNGNIEFDHQQCKYVGDAAGRPKTKTTPRDHSACDYLFALNLGLEFETPESFFLRSKLALHTKPSGWELGFNPKTGIPQMSDEEKERLIESFGPAPDQQQELVIVVGSPASGKSSLSRNYFPTYERVNQDTLKNLAKCLKVAREKLSEGKSVIVDNTNRDTQTRGQWIELAREKDIPIRCIWVDIPKDLCFHLNTFRSIQQPTSEEDKTNDEGRGRKVPSPVIHTFYKNYDKPLVKEGFTRVTKIGFIPGPFASDENRDIFFMYLD